jgi:hypothetical protein
MERHLSRALGTIRSMEFFMAQRRPSAQLSSRRTGTASIGMPVVMERPARSVGGPYRRRRLLQHTQLGGIGESARRL